MERQDREIHKSFWDWGRGLFLSCFIALAVLGLGCSTQSPKYLSPEFGKSYDALFSSQVIKPDAPRDRSPADTLPGELAGQIYKNRYIKSMITDKKKKETVKQQLGGGE